MQKCKKILLYLYQAFIKTIEHDGIEHSGYMSFIVLLSVFPFLVFFLALTSFFGASEVGENFIRLLLENMPDKSIDALQYRVQELGLSPPQSLLTLAIVGAIWTASSFVEGLRTILNRVYEIQSPPPYIWRRLLSIGQFLIISIIISIIMFLLLVVSMGFSKILVIVEVMHHYTALIKYIKYLLILSALFFSVASLYYMIPNIALNFLKVIPGSVLTVFLWTLSAHLLSTYIIYYNQLNIIYGSLCNIIVTLIFFYIINFIFIYGAEFNYLLQSLEEH
jgi:membrane protein